MKALPRFVALAGLILMAGIPSCKDEILVVVPVAVVEIQGPGSIEAGSSAQYTAVPKDDRGNRLTGRTITWATNNGSLATVSSEGTLTGVLGGQVTITARAEGQTGSLGIQVNNPVPVVNSTEPALSLVSGNTLQLTVQGSGFVQTSVVLWGGEERVTTFESPTTLRAAITQADLAIAGIFQLTVFNPSPGGGTSGARAFRVENPPPTVTETNPSVITAGSGAFDLTVLGSGFVSTSVVRWNGNDRVTAFVNPGEMRAAILAQDIANTGTVQITVYTPQPGGGTSGDQPLTVGNPVPVIGSVSPNHVTMGLGQVIITITGTGFVPASRVEWDGDARQTGYLNGTTLRVTLPADDVSAPGWKTLAVTNPSPGGGTTEPEPFGVRIPVVGPYVAVGTNHTCALSTDGQAYCLGLNSNGQLGDGSHDDSTDPQFVALPAGTGYSGSVREGSAQQTPVAGTQTLVALTAGGAHTCGLTEVGQAYCWGYGGFGQLGNGAFGSQNEPAPVDLGLHFVSLRAGFYHTCGITADGQVHCWGRNDFGQLGDGSWTHQPAPTPVEQGTFLFEALGAGYYHTCGVTTAGAIHCWGRNNRGQLGDGSEVDRGLPAQVPGLNGMVGVTLGNEHTCGWSTSGTAYCWGRGWEGELGDDNYSNSPIPVGVAGAFNFERMEAGTLHTCGVTPNGEVVCWGYGYYGQLGLGESTGEGSPVVVGGLPFSSEVAPGDHHSCALTPPGQLFCWGEEGYGQLGNGWVSYRLIPTLVTGGPAEFTRISTGWEHSCGVSDMGRAFCWGGGADGQIGDGTYLASALPVEVVTGQTFSFLTLGGSHTCGRTPTGEAYCWGAGWYGQLGSGGFATEPFPTAVVGGHTFFSLRAGDSHTCGVTDGGQVLCWGLNNNGQLGNGSTVSTSVPTPISAPPGRSFIRAKVGYRHTCANTTTGEVWCWGANQYGQLGDGTFEQRLTPVQVTGLPADVNWFAVGGWHSCAADSTGKAMCWGNHWSGRLGGNYSDHQPTPQAVTGGHLFRALFGNLDWTCGITHSDQGYCWGSGYYGQLGSGNFSSPSEPMEIAGNHAWATLSPGGSQRHHCGLTRSGEAYCWGWQRVGALGIGTLGTQPFPMQVNSSLTFGEPAIPAPGEGSSRPWAQGRNRGVPFRDLLRPSRGGPGGSSGLFRIGTGFPPNLNSSRAEVLPACLPGESGGAPCRVEAGPGVVGGEPSFTRRGPGRR